MEYEKHIHLILAVAMLLICFLYHENTHASETVVLSEPVEAVSVLLPDTDKFGDWAVNMRIETNFMAYITGGEFDFDGFFAQLYNLTLAELDRVPWNHLQNYTPQPSVWSPAEYLPGEPIGAGILETYADRVVFPSGTYRDKTGNIYNGGINDAINSLNVNEWLVFVKKGTYESGFDIYNSNVVLAGEGWQTVLRMPAGFNNHVITVRGQAGAGNVIIRDLLVDGNRANNPNESNQNGIAPRDVTNCLIENVYVTSVRQFGLDAYYSNVAYFINCLARDNCWNDYEFTRCDHCACVGCYGDTWTDVGVSTWESTNILIAWCVFENPLPPGEGATRANWAIGVEAIMPSESYNVLVRKCDGSDLQTQSDRGSGVVILEGAHHIVVDHGTYNNNSFYGICLEPSSNNINLFGNNITNNKYGIRLWGSSNNIIYGNHLINNDCDIDIRYSSNNEFYDNNIINNTPQVYIDKFCANFWDNSVEGNYWSDYTGVDSNYDGIGDSLHVIGANNTDHYPLMGMFSSFNTFLGYDVNVISNSTIEDFQYFRSNSTIMMRVSNSSSSQHYNFCRLCIPHALMSEPYNVTIDGANPIYCNYTLYDNGNHRWIYFAFQHSTREVVIQGSDTEPPIISVLSPESKTYTVNDFLLTFTVDEPIDWIGYSLDAQKNVTIAENTTLSGLSEGPHSLVVYAKDTAGNVGLSDIVYFAIDTAPPKITDVSQSPPENNVLPEDEVKVNATVTDNISGVRKVILNYTHANNSGIWSIVIDMTNLEGNLWNATIPAFPYGTNVTYSVIAEDKGDNTISTKEMGYEYQYQVIPEFPSLTILPLIMISTLLALLVYRRQHSG